MLLNILGFAILIAWIAADVLIIVSGLIHSKKGEEDDNYE